MTTSHRIRWVFLAAGLAAAALGAGSCSKGRKGQMTAPASPVVVAEAAAQDIPYLVQTVGQVQAYSTVAVKAQVGGAIMGVNFREGQDVKKNDVLFLIDRRPFEVALKQAESQIEKDRALLRNAESDLTRYANLVRKDYVTREQYDSLVANRDVLLASIKADEASIANASLQLEYCTITSPIDGRAGSLLIYPGNIIKANDTNPAVVIYQIIPIYVSFSVPQQYLPTIKEYMSKGQLKTEAFLTGESSPSATGELTFVDNAIDTSTGTIMLKATFANTDRALWPGQSLNVSLTLFVEKNAVVVPSQAVQTSQSGQYVFVVKSDMTVEMRTVKVDRSVGEQTVITDGLKAGETVVTDGLLRLTPGSRVEIQPRVREAP
jgi:multidrug efflux system membrane fusion protein